MCIRDRTVAVGKADLATVEVNGAPFDVQAVARSNVARFEAVSYTHLRAHETVLDLVCRLLLEKKKQQHTHDDDYLDRTSL